MNTLTAVALAVAAAVWGAAMWLDTNFGARIDALDRRLAVLERDVAAHREWHETGLGAGDEGLVEEIDPDDLPSIFREDPEAVTGPSKEGLREALAALGGIPPMDKLDMDLLEFEAYRRVVEQDYASPVAGVSDELNKALILRIFLPMLNRYLQANQGTMIRACEDAAAREETPRTKCFRLGRALGQLDELSAQFEEAIPRPELVDTTGGFVPVDTTPRASRPAQQ